MYLAHLAFSQVSKLAFVPLLSFLLLLAVCRLLDHSGQLTSGRAFAQGDEIAAVTTFDVNV